MNPANPWAETLWQRVKRIHEQDQLRAEPDGELLRRFADTRDESAFEELLRRHGPLVWGVCTRTLGVTPEAEDSFQAVFLILVRKAKQIRSQAQVAGWLYGTAQKVVRRARQQRLRRQSREQTPEPFHEPGHTPESPRDWIPLFDHALQKLPEKYREVLILCEIQQRTRSEVAGLLSLNENTLSSRLARAKEMLRAKLAPTGVALPVGLVATAGVPATLQSATLQLSVQLASHAGSLSLLPVTLFPLVHGGSNLMFISKSFTCLAVGVLVGLGLINSEATPQNKVDPPPVKGSATVPKKEPVPQFNPVGFVDSGTVPSPPLTSVPSLTDLDRMQGRWEVKSFSRQAAGDEKAPPSERSVLFQKNSGLNEVWIRGKEIWLTLSQAQGIIGTFHLGEQFDPKRIDIQLPEKDAPENTSPAFGVYSFASNGELTLLFGPDRINRPSLEKDEVPPKSEVIELVLTQKKETNVSLPDEVKELLGSWTITNTVHMGKPVPEMTTLEFSLNKVLFEMKDPKSTKMRLFTPMLYKINGAKNPRWITLEVPKGIEGGGEFHGRGIYSVVGDTLTVAFSDKGSRPSEFESSETNDIMVITAKRNPTPQPRDLPLPTENPTPKPMPGEPINPNVIELNHGKVTIPIQLNEVTAREVRSVILWISEDRGATFTHSKEMVVSEASSFEFETLRSGEVQFAIQTVNKQGVAFPPVESLKPQLKVRFVLPSDTPRTIPPLKLEYAPLKEATPATAESNRLQRENLELRQRLDELMKRVETLEKSAKAKK